MSQTPHAIAADHQTPTIGTAWSVEEGALAPGTSLAGTLVVAPMASGRPPDVSTSSASTPTTTTVSACQSPFPIAPTSLLDAVMTTRSSSSPSLTTAFSPGREPSTRSLLGRLLVGRPIPVVSRGRCVRPGMARGIRGCTGHVRPPGCGTVVVGSRRVWRRSGPRRPLRP